MEYIRKWSNSDFRKLQHTSQEYYDGIQDIRHKERGYEDEQNINIKYPKCVPNTTLTYNLYRKLVDQKVMFISERKLRFISGTAPPTDYSDTESVKEEGTGDIDPTDGYKVEKKEDSSLLTHETTEEQDRCNEFLRLLENLFDRKWYNKFHEALTYVMLDGDCWLYPYINSKGEFSYRFFRGYDICPIYTDESHEELAAIVRVYDVQRPDNEAKIQRYVEIYRKENMIRYEVEETKQDDKIIARLINGKISDYISPINTRKDTVASTASGPTSYKWSKLPFIHITQSESPQPLLARCKSILDAINDIYSNWIDNILTHDLKSPTKSVDFESILVGLREVLFDVCCAIDTSEIVSKSNPRELVIQTVMLMEQDANTLIASIEYALYKFVYDFFCPYLTLKGFKDYSTISTEIKVDDDIRFRNIAEYESPGMRMSNRTMLEHHPWVTDVDEELDRILQEKLLRPRSSHGGQGRPPA